ncbi:MAG: hypothetical protein R3245_10520 [Kiloniellales bacterium]|nr:hypothetical protein [Kiloniellales bacterium]
MKNAYVKSAAIVLAASTLTACAGSVVTTPALIDESYDPNSLAYIVKEGPVLTEIIGQPFAGQEKMVDEVITTTFQETQITGHNISFTTDAAKAGKSPYRMVILFDPAPSANPDKLCESSDGDSIKQAKVTGGPGQIRMLVSFCNSERSGASLMGYVTADSPTEPQFKKLIQQASLELFSNRSIERRGGNDFDSN